ncbi:MAG: MFS transporter [Verrucomicrobiota bacterium]|jgi:PAT family beta-lactamase induction signal transducer AmpG
MPTIPSATPAEAKTGPPKAPYPNPFLWVPSSYLAMGVIYVTVGSVANVMFKNMGMDNTKAAFWSSLLGFPYTFKFLWAPLLELYRTKKFFVVLMQFCIAASIACVAFALRLPGMTWFVPVLALLALSGLLGATQDIGSDGVYVTTLPPKEMAKYTGFQSMCWNAGFLLAAGPLIYFSGVLHRQTQSWGTSWMVIMLVISGLLFLAGLYHSRFLPPGAKAPDAPKSFGDAMGTFGHAFATFFQKKDIWLMMAFAFFYRSGYGLIDKMGPLFMIDDRAKGGLGLSNETLGTINGTFGNAAFILGSLLGGWFVSRISLKKSLFILCLCLNVPNVTFLILSQTLPTSYTVIATIVTFEKFGWGVGCVGHMIYMMQQIAPGPYRTAHYTFATALMGACMMLTGAVSGYLESWTGYQWFFIIVLFAAAPSILVTFFAPFHNPDTTGRNADAQPEATEAS